jgi:hypothetical protein
MRIIALLVVAGLLCAATPALATRFDFTYAGASISGSGVLVATDNGNGIHDPKRWVP